MSTTLATRTVNRREPVLKTTPRCPTCGRPDVVTFRAFSPVGKSISGTPPLVCIRCAPRPKAS